MASIRTLWSPLASTSVLLGLTACVSISLPPRGVSVDHLELAAEPVVSMAETFPESEGLQHVLEITDEPATAEIRVVGSHGVVWLDRTGSLTRWVAFEGSERVFPVRSFDAGGEVGYVGLIGRSFSSGRDAGRGTVVVFDADGRRRSELPADYASAFFPANLTPGPAREIAVESILGRAFHVFGLDGRRLHMIAADGDITRTFPTDSDGDGRSEVAIYTYPVGDAAHVQILDSTSGRALYSWPAPILGGFVPGATSWGRSGILALVGEELRIYGFGGEVLETAPFPDGDRFADLESLLLPDGRRVTLATGDGSLYGHTLLIHGQDGGILYHRVERNRAHGLAAATSPLGTTIYYGVGDTVWALRGL